MRASRLRVALLSQHFAEYACLLARGLAEQCDVLLILNLENAANELGVHWQRRFAHPSLQLLALPKARSVGAVWGNAILARRALREFRPEVLHCQEGGIWDELMPSILNRRCPLVLTVHDPVAHGGSDRKRLAWSRHRAYQAWLRRSCDAAVVHGELLRGLLADRIPRLAARTFAVPHGVLGPDCGALVTDWETGTLLFFGRINEYKGLGDFIAAVEMLGQRGVPVRAVVAGRGPDLERHRARIAASPLFTLHDGFVPPEQVACLFAEANVVVLPYREGTQSGVAALALGYGRPLVATRVGSIPELVLHGENGLVVEPQSPQRLADAIEKLVRDQFVARSMAQRSWELGRGSLSWNSIARRTTAVYRFAISGHSEDIPVPQPVRDSAGSK